MKTVEIILIAVGVFLATLMFSHAALACAEHEEWPEPSETPPLSALGQEGDYCEFQDGECADGLECTGLPCLTAPCDPDDADCIDGETQCPMGGICSAVVVVTSCETDDDCTDGQTCSIVEIYCPTAIPDCAPDDDDCEPTDASDCVPGTYGQCEDVINKPGQCSTDADCGSEAFECSFTEVCECTGGFMADDEESGSFEEENCTCTTLDEGYCQLVEKTCETNADCSGAYEGFDCVDTTPSGACFIDSETGEQGCAEPEASKQCLPTSTTPPGLQYDKNNSEDAASGSASNGGGCHIGGATSTSVAYLPLLMGLMLLVVRRRFAHSA